MICKTRRVLTFYHKQEWGFNRIPENTFIDTLKKSESEGTIKFRGETYYWYLGRSFNESFEVVPKYAEEFNSL